MNGIAPENQLNPRLCVLDVPRVHKDHGKEWNKWYQSIERVESCYTWLVSKGTTTTTTWLSFRGTLSSDVIPPQFAYRVCYSMFEYVASKIDMLLVKICQTEALLIMNSYWLIKDLISSDDMVINDGRHGTDFERMQRLNGRSTRIVRFS